MKKHLLLICFSCLSIFPLLSQISPLLWGQNYWYTNMSSTNPASNTDLSNWSEVKLSGVKLMRVGGTNYNQDAFLTRPRDAAGNIYAQGYVSIVDNIRAQKSEPMIQVPFDPFDADVTHDLTYYAKQAAEIVRVLNIVHKRNVQYFIIANEPVLNYSASYATATNIANYTKAFAVEMRKVDPKIKIIGTENHLYDYSLYKTLFFNAGTNNIGGFITAAEDPSGVTVGLPFVDFMSFHFYGYGFQSSSPTRANVFQDMEKCDQAASPTGDIYTLRDYLDHAKNGLSTVNASRGIYPLGLMITEANVCYNNQITTSSTTSSDILNGMDARSFLGGQYWARILTMGMEYGVNTVNFWSVKEGCDPAFGPSGGTPNINNFNKTDIGYVDCNDGHLYPSFYHYKMLADHFKGTYLKDELISSTSTTLPANGYAIKAFASKGSYIAVMVTNHNLQTGTSFKNIDIRLDGALTATSNAPNEFSFSAGLSGIVKTYAVEDEATALFLFNCTSGNLVKRLDYRKRVEAAGNLPPTESNTTDFSSSFTPNATQCLLNTNLTPNTLSAVTAVVYGATSHNWTGPNGYTFSGNPATGISIPGTYTVTCNTTCGVVQEIATVYKKSPIVDAGADQYMCGSVTSVNIGNGNLIGATYTWANSPAGTSPTGKNPAVSPSSPTSYTMTASDGTCKIDDATFVIAGAADLYIKDSPEDIGTEPNTETGAAPGGVYWASPDLYLRQTNDGFTNQTSQAVEYQSGVNNYIYVRVKNRGCSVQNGTLRVYWAKASTGLSWDSQWVNYMPTTYPGCTATLFGNEITSSTGINISLAAGAEQIYEIPWQAVYPDGFSCFGPDQNHFCLTARIETAAGPNYGMTFPETTAFWSNVHDNNNIVWKNIIINNYTPGIIINPFGTVIVRNVVRKANFIKLNFDALKDDNGQTLTDFNRVRLHFSQDFLKRWFEGGKRGKGIVLINDSTIEVTSSNATMEHIFLRYEEAGGMAISLKGIKQPVVSKDKNFLFRVTQFSEGTDDKFPQGGQDYQIEKGFNGLNCTTPRATLSGVIVGLQQFTGELLINNNVIVPAGATLIFKGAKVFANDNLNIRVLPGGIIKIIESEFYSACTDKKWNGIEVKGNPLLSNPLLIDRSYFTGTDFPLTVDKSKGILITNSSFVGTGLGTAISLDKMKDFEISGNTFDGYSVGINTTKTYIADIKSIIVKNVFNNVKTAINFSQDNHIKLDVKCNQFNYAEYAINSDQTILKNQGAVTEGAGNEFTTTSVLPNNKIKHMNGNNPKYYYDPANPIASGMNVTVLASSLNPMCYSYSFDTSSVFASRMAAPNSIEAISKKGTIDILAVPNPNVGQASIFFNLGEDSNGEVIIMDIYGKILDRIKVTSTSQKVDVNYTEYANGIYMITLINSKGEAVNKKMIISK